MRRYVPILLLATFLSGCGAASSVDLNKPIDTSGIATHIQTAQNYVNIAYAAMDACALSGLSICAPAKIAQVKAVANEALAQARDVANSNATLAQTLLRVAMNAVLAYYGSR